MWRLPFLKVAETWAPFHPFGRSPELRDIVKMSARGRARTSAWSWSSRGWSPSGPDALVILSLGTSFCTSFGLILILCSTESVLESLLNFPWWKLRGRKQLEIRLSLHLSQFCFFLLDRGQLQMSVSASILCMTRMTSGYSYSSLQLSFQTVLPPLFW